MNGGSEAETNGEDDKSMDVMKMKVEEEDFDIDDIWSLFIFLAFKVLEFEHKPACFIQLAFTVQLDFRLMSLVD